MKPDRYGAIRVGKALELTKTQEKQFKRQLKKAEDRNKAIADTLARTVGNFIAQNIPLTRTEEENIIYSLDITILPTVEYERLKHLKGKK